MASNILVLPTARDRVIENTGYLTRVWRVFMEQLLQKTNSLKSYTVATLPSGSVTGAMIFVTNEIGGSIPAFWDGLNWRRVTDRAVVT